MSRLVYCIRCDQTVGEAGADTDMAPIVFYEHSPMDWVTWFELHLLRHGSCTERPSYNYLAFRIY